MTSRQISVGQCVFCWRRFVPALAQLQDRNRPLTDGCVQGWWLESLSDVRAATASVSTMAHGCVDVAVGIVHQEIPDSRAPARLRTRPCTWPERRRSRNGQHGVLADVLGDVLLRVVRPHLLLVDVLLEDVAQHIGVDLVVGAQRALVQMPLVLVEVVKDALESLIWDLDGLAVAVGSF